MDSQLYHAGPGLLIAELLNPHRETLAPSQFLMRPLIQFSHHGRNLQHPVPQLSDTVLFFLLTKEDHGTGHFDERASFCCETNLL